MSDRGDLLLECGFPGIELEDTDAAEDLMVRQGSKINI